MLFPGNRFEGYVVDGALGHGGSATVYRAHDAAGPDHVVALKVLDDHHRQPVQIARLQREFDFARRLDHPHIIKVDECGQGWLAMELVDGGTVAKLQGLSDRLAALAQMAGALDYAHQHGIVHCDVKPSNILVLITGSPPFTATTSMGLMDEQLHSPPPKLSRKIDWLPHAFDSIMSKALAKSADNRYESCSEFISLITRALQ